MTEPAGLLMPFVLSILTPFLMTAGLSPDHARAAAAEAIAAHNGSLLNTAQTVAFALTALDNLRLSLPPELSLSMKLRLRGNANALTRSAHRAAAPEPKPHPEPKPAPEPDQTEILATLQTAQTLVKQPVPPERQPVPPERQADLSWAAAMTDVAAEYTAELPNLAPADRRTHLARIAALSEIACTLSQGQAPSLKARLLGSTSLPQART